MRKNKTNKEASLGQHYAAPKDSMKAKMHDCVFRRCGLCKTVTFGMKNVIDINIVDVFFRVQECHLNVY